MLNLKPRTLFSLQVQHFAHCVAAGSPRARVLLVDQLEAIVNALAVSRPQLVRKGGP